MVMLNSQRVQQWVLTHPCFVASIKTLPLNLPAVGLRWTCCVIEVLTALMNVCSRLLYNFSLSMTKKRASSLQPHAHTFWSHAFALATFGQIMIRSWSDSHQIMYIFIHFSDLHLILCSCSWPQSPRKKTSWSRQADLRKAHLAHWGADSWAFDVLGEEMAHPDVFILTVIDAFVQDLRLEDARRRAKVLTYRWSWTLPKKTDARFEWQVCIPLHRVKLCKTDKTILGGYLKVAA